MSWHYQARHKINEFGETAVDIVEMFTDPVGWTDESIAPIGESLEELINVLETMIADAKKYKMLYEEN